MPFKFMTPLHMKEALCSHEIMGKVDSQEDLQGWIGFTPQVIVD